MEKGADATPSPTAQRSNKLITILLFVAGILSAGLIYTLAFHDPPASCPDELIGAWETSAGGYEDGMLVFTKHGVAFSVGAEHLDAQAVRRLEVTPEGNRTLYTVVYGDSRNDEQTLSFYFHPRDRTITFKNQSNLVWTKKTVDS